MPPPANPVLDRMRSGAPALGLIARLSRSGDIARIARATGHDFVFIDVQHAIYDLETIAHIANVGLGIGIGVLVRVRSVSDPDVSVLLDAGVSGIVFPDVSTAAEARRAVEIARFPPLGRRSVGASYPHYDCRAVPVEQAAAELNASTLLAVMIETVEGLGNVEEIAKVDGIDVLHVGSNDLLADMGLAGRFDDPAIVAAQDRVIRAADACGRFAGCGGNRDVARQAAAIRAGARFLTTQTDVAFLSAAAAQWAAAVRKAIG